MPRPTPHLFISATSHGLKEYREEVRRALGQKGVFGVVQEEFPTDYRAIREMLKDKISTCDGVICLIGPFYGFEPKERQADQPRRSYTQLEYFIAQELGRPTYRFFAECSEFHDLEQESDELQRLQQEFIAQVRRGEEIHYKFIDKAELRDLVLKIAAQPHDPEAKPQNLPYLSLGSLFKGRETLLQELGGCLHAASGSCTVIYGLGGVGKTRLAVEYALCNAGAYNALLFVTADTPEALRRNLAALCGPLVLNLSEWAMAEEDVRVQAALRWLQNNRGWLLILDNADTEAAAQAVERFLGNLQSGHILITSRLTEWGAGIGLLEVDVLESDAASEFLLERTHQRRRMTANDIGDATNLAKALEYLALALEQAGAYISQKRCSLSDYHSRWSERDSAVRGWFSERLMNYSRSVATTWLTTLEQLTPDATSLLRTLSWLDSEPLPRTILPTDELQDSLAELCNYSLVKTTANGEQFRVLRVVQEVTRDQQNPQEQAASLQSALDLLNAAAPGSPHDVRNWPLWELLRPHVAAAVAHAIAHEIDHPTARLMNQFALLLYSKALYEEAEPLMRRALAIAEASFGPDHSTVAMASNNLAQLLKATNRLAEAEPLMRRALAIDEGAFGHDHHDVAIDLNNLAQLLQDTNRLAEAEPLMRRALAIDEKLLGSDHPDVAIDLNNLAQLLEDTNRLAEAEPLMRRALAIDEESFEPDHPRVATGLNNLAQLLKATNRLAEAEPLMRRALTIDEASFGSDHPDVAIDLNNLAQLLKATNRLAEAEPLMRRALAIEEASFGPDHPVVAIDLNNLALLLKATNRLAEAEPLFRRALAIDEGSFGTDHPSLARDLNNLAQLLVDTNRLAEAEPLMRRALAIEEHSFGSDHPRVARGLNNLAELLGDTDRLSEAEPLMLRALAIDEESFGTDHPSVATDLNNLAQLLQATNRMAEAEPLMRRALAIDEESFGAAHPSVAIDLNNLAQLLRFTNRPAEAEPLMRRAVKILEDSFGPHHPHAVIVRGNLSHLLNAIDPKENKE